MTTTRRGALAGALALAAAAMGTVALAGCSAANGSQTSPAPTPPASAPGGGQLLRERGIVHGPAAMALPSGVTITRIIDQPNVVTLVFARQDGPTVLDYLTLHAAAMGLADVRTGNDSIVFTLDGWEGGFTISNEIAGLTLRRLT